MSTMENEDKRIGLVIMASGLGRRFGGNKLMAILGEKPLIQWILDTTDDLFDKRVVVTRSMDVKALCENRGIACVYHELPNRNDTVFLGTKYCMEAVDYCFFVPGDQPLLKRETIKMLIACARKSDKIIRAGFLDAIGAPIGFPKMYFNELLTLPEKKGGSWVANQHEKQVEIVMVNDESELWDVDTKEDLKRMEEI